MTVIGRLMEEENLDALEAIIRSANCILDHDREEAARIIQENIPHQIYKRQKRNMSTYEKLKIYMRDGFIDRYTGKKLLFPNVLRVLSFELRDDFPYQKNWKMSECHMAYWNLCPTYDHVVPIARGGCDTEENIVTTSMLMNAVKSNWLLEEIKLKLHEPGSLEEWDGMIAWYKSYISANGKPEFKSDTSFEDWDKALRRYEQEYAIV